MPLACVKGMILVIALLWQSFLPAIAEQLDDLETPAEATSVELNCDVANGSAPSSRDEYIEYAACKARAAGLPAHIAAAVIEIESNFNPSALGADGEVGLMQVMPPTAHLMGFRGTVVDLADPATNISLGVRYLAEAFHLSKGDLCTTVMKYRAGHGETRFSVLSVRYCEKARAILQRDGILVTGAVPKPTFGFAASGGVGAGTCLRRSFKPGPGYGRCISVSGGQSAKSAIAQRRALFN